MSSSSSSSSSSKSAAQALAEAAGIAPPPSEKGPAKSGIPTVLYSNPRRWTVVYPRYLDIDATIAAGRRIPKSFCVSTPTVPDLLEAAQILQLKIAFEDKMYSRDYWQRGRIRVQLRKDDETYLNANITSKKDLLIKLGEVIPKLPNRNGRMQQLEGMKKQAQQANMPFIMPQFVPITPQMQRPPAAAAMAANATANPTPQGMPMGMGMPGGFPPGFPMGSPSSASAPAASPSSSSSSSSSAVADGNASGGSGGGGGGKKKKKKGKK